MHRARKRFGQNFLQDDGVLHRIMRALAADPDRPVVEIGPGRGALTEVLLAEGLTVTAIELDRDLLPILRARLFNHAERLTLINADALHFDYASLSADHQPLQIVGNLPYNITTPLLFHLLQYQAQLDCMVFMLQKEVVDRLSAEPGGSDYGRLSVMMQFYCTVEPLFEVPPEAFTPQPKVDSAVVRLTPKPLSAADLAVVPALRPLVRQAFAQRRKTLRNNLRDVVNDAQFAQLGIDPSLRPQTIALADYVRLAQLLQHSEGFV
jgi:16S rRNA (adenine1518-N6/adenine1519-N6)-dimethyltransferase